MSCCMYASESIQPVLKSIVNSSDFVTNYSMEREVLQDEFAIISLSVENSFNHIAANHNQLNLV